MNQMKTAHQIPHPLLPLSPPPPAATTVHRRLRHAQHQSPMPLRPHLPFRHLTTTATCHQLPPHPINIIFVYHKTMADQSKEKDSQLGFKPEGKEEESEKKSKSTVEKPPPPEKPLPGDCCGSGCVRCVWDVYYEELEEYNRLYKSDPPSKTS